MRQGDDCLVKLNLNNKNNKLWKLIFTEETGKESIPKSQAFQQSFFRKKGDCEDIHDACQVLLEQKKADCEGINDARQGVLEQNFYTPRSNIVAG